MLGKWFYCDEIGAPGETADLANRERRHLFKTMRARFGTKIVLCDGAGKLAQAEVTEDGALQITYSEQKTIPSPAIHLYCAFPRRNQAEQMLKQCVETGVTSITPIHTEHSVALPKEDAKDRWRQLLFESCKQAKNPFAPAINKLIDFKAALLEVKEKGYSAYYGATSMEDSNNAKIAKGVDVAWFVGPEGGFSPAETDLMRQNAFEPLSLGPWILRVETAAVVGISVLRHFLNNMEGK